MSIIQTKNFSSSQILNRKTIKNNRTALTIGYSGFILWGLNFTALDVPETTPKSVPFYLA